MCFSSPQWLLFDAQNTLSLLLLFSCSVVCDSFVTVWTVAYQAPVSLGFPRQEYWSGLPFPSPGDLPDPEIEPESPGLPADSLPPEPPGMPKMMSNWPCHLLGHKGLNSCHFGFGSLSSVPLYTFSFVNKLAEYRGPDKSELIYPRPHN